MNRSFLVLFFKKRLLALLFATSLLLAGPLTVARAGGWYDDYLFVRLARFLLHGQWLGPFNSLTLIKGPFYPIFLAACAAGGLPVQVATQCVYLAGALLLARTAGRLAGSRAAGTLCFALLALNPACYDWSATMLMREPLYGGLTTLVLALAARAFLCPGNTLWPVLLGIAGAAFWLTREEGVLLAPPVLLMAAWHLRHHRPFRAALAGPLVAGAVSLALVASVCAVNRYEYGVFRTNDVKGGPFARAYGALVRVDPDQWRRLVPVARETRLRIYAASPAASELQPYLEGDSAHLSTDVDCAALPQPACHDLDGAHFLFALRDAVARAGHYKTARDADRFYTRLAREIDAACDRRALACSARRSGLWPQLSLHYAKPFARSLLRIGADMAQLGRPHAAPILSLMHGPDEAAYDDILAATPIAPPDDFLTAPGWQISGAFGAADPSARIVVAGPPGTAVQSELRQTVNTAISGALHYPAGQGQNFSAAIRCQPGALPAGARGRRRHAGQLGTGGAGTRRGAEHAGGHGFRQQRGTAATLRGAAVPAHPAHPADGGLRPGAARADRADVAARLRLGRLAHRYRCAAPRDPSPERVRACPGTDGRSPRDPAGPA